MDRRTINRRIIGRESPQMFIGKNIKSNINHFALDYLEIKKRLKIPYPLKTYYNPSIPLNIFQTWHTKNLPPLMSKTVNSIINDNPAFKYYLFDDDDCRNFIRDNYSSEVLNAFDSLIPGAYKADLWRYCVLYKEGGIYLDIKYKPVSKFKFINLTEKEHWVLDIDKNGVYNALIVCNAGNEILLKAIKQIVINVKNKYYGNSSLEPTGPLLLAKYFTKEQKERFDMQHFFFQNHNNRFITFNNYLVFKQYDGYIEEHNKNEKVSHYAYLWMKRNIYK
jgi:mannosyltransferase OCH1-like enzyme